MVIIISFRITHNIFFAAVHLINTCLHLRKIFFRRCIDRKFNGADFHRISKFNEVLITLNRQLQRLIRMNKIIRIRDKRS